MDWKAAFDQLVTSIKTKQHTNTVLLAASAATGNDDHSHHQKIGAYIAYQSLSEEIDRLTEKIK